MTEFLPGPDEPWDDGSIPWASPATWRAPAVEPESAPQETNLDLYCIGERSLSQWFLWLTHDEDGNPTGHLQVPCSRYGSTGADVAWWAIALGCVYQHGCGDPDDPGAAMDGYMGLCVNDQDGVAELLREFLYAVPPEVIALLGGEEEIQRVVGEQVTE
jgi:hypothetical protein